MVKTGRKSFTKITVPNDVKKSRLIVLDQTNCEELGQLNNEPNKDMTRILDRTFTVFNYEIKEREFYVYEDEIFGLDINCNEQPNQDTLLQQSINEFAANKNVVLLIENLKFTESDDYRRDIESTFDQNDVLLSRRNIIIGRKVIKSTVKIKLHDIDGELLGSKILSTSYSYEIKAADRLNAISILRQRRRDGLKNLGAKIGFKIADAVSPYDIEILRFYYANTRNNEKFNLAEDIIQEEGDWESARILWTEITELGEDEEDRAKAFFNIGVYHERKGEFKKAVEALQKSASINSEVGSGYYSDLRSRYN
jgi:tetratricopeptide (TPR) repeat protein